MQHELVHAEFFRDLLVLIGYNNSVEDDIDYYQALSLLADAINLTTFFLINNYNIIEAYVLNGFGESPEVLEHMGYNLSELSTNAMNAINYIISEGTIINETLLGCQ